jgi:hypothetical protein
MLKLQKRFKEKERMLVGLRLSWDNWLNDPLQSANQNSMLILKNLSNPNNKDKLASNSIKILRDSASTKGNAYLSYIQVLFIFNLNAPIKLSYMFADNLHQIRRQGS